MNYAELRKKDLDVASGVVEGAVRHVIVHGAGLNRAFCAFRQHRPVHRFTGSPVHRQQSRRKIFLDNGFQNIRAQLKN
jgi:hypothetical protein